MESGRFLFRENGRENAKIALRLTIGSDCNKIHKASQKKGLHSYATLVLAEKMRE